MKKLLSISALLYLAPPKLAHAVCPVCTVAVGAGLGMAQYLGIDDSISGVWIGGLIISLIIWTIDWLDKKDIRFIGRKILVVAGYYLLIVGPLWWKGFIAQNPVNTLCGIDRLLFGIILGSILFSAGVILHNFIRKRNDSTSYFKGQKIVFGIAPLVIASLILYFTC